jgi:hypothetical protein
MPLPTQRHTQEEVPTNHTTVYPSVATVLYCQHLAMPVPQRVCRVVCVCVCVCVDVDVISFSVPTTTSNQTQRTAVQAHTQHKSLTRREERQVKKELHRSRPERSPSHPHPPHHRPSHPLTLDSSLQPTVFLWLLGMRHTPHTKFIKQNLQ